MEFNSGLRAGYAYSLPRWFKLEDWFSINNDDWEISMVQAFPAAKFIGEIVIDGSACDVFECSDGKIRAQINYK